MTDEPRPVPIDASRPGAIEFRDLTLFDFGDGRLLLVFPDNPDMQMAEHLLARVRDWYPNSRVLVAVDTPAKFVPLENSQSLREYIRAIVKEELNVPSNK